MEQSAREDEKRDGIKMHGMVESLHRCKCQKSLSSRVQQLQPRRKLNELILVTKVLDRPASAVETDRGDPITAN